MARLIFSVLDVIWNYIRECSLDPTKRGEFINDKKFFTRRTLLSFKTIIGVILCSFKSNIVSNLERFLGRDDSGVPVEGVTKAAFSEQRNKVKFNFFENLLTVFRDAFYKNFQPHLKRWKTWIPTAIDGTRMSLPDNPETREYFGAHTHARSKVKSALGRASFCYDILNNIILVGELVNQKIGEIILAAKAILQLSKEHLIILDRGYCSFFLLYLLNERGNKFVCRCKSGLIKSAKAFLNSKSNDDFINLKAYHKATKQLKENGYIVKIGQLMQVRAVKIKLESGQIEVLLTNLTPEEATVSELSELYNLRWKEEVAIGIMKNEQQLEIFTGVRINCIMQDFYATLFLYNFEMLLEKFEEERIVKINEAHKKRGELPVAIDHNECWQSAKEMFIFWIKSDDLASSHKAISNSLQLFERHRYSVREGRKFPRTFRVIKLLGKYITLNNYRAVS